MTRRFVVLGAGMAGLVTALELIRRGADVTILESRNEPGGTIRTLRVHGCTVDAGPEALVVGTRPEALAVCASLGLSDRMIRPDDRAGTWLARRSGALPFPDGLAMGVPRRLGHLVTTPVLSWMGKLRASLDLVLPANREPALGALIERRFGREVKDRLVEPIFGGIYGADVDRLEAEFVAPHLARARGSLIRAMSKQRIAAESPLRAPLGGMAQMVDAIVERVGRERIRLGAGATRITRRGREWRADAIGCESLDADDVVIATPPHAAATIARTIDAPLADHLSALRSHSTASVVLGYDATDVRLPRIGGIFVPRTEAGALLGATIVSNRWPESAPEGTLLVRALVGGARAPDLVDGASDDAIALEARSALDELLPLPQPRWQHVVRFSRSQVCPEVGHVRNVALARERAKAVGGVHLVGAAYDGGGIAGILARAERTAEQILS